MSTINVATLNHVKLKCFLNIYYLAVYSLYLDICIGALGLSLPAAGMNVLHLRGASCVGKL